MPDTRRRWFITLVLGIGALAFLSLSVSPVIMALLDRSSSDPTVVDPVANEQIQAQIEGYQAVLEREPENQIALQNLAQLWLQLGDLDEATAPLTKLVELNPEQQDWAVLLAQIKIETGAPAEGATILADLYEDDPDNFPLLETLVNAEAAAGNTEAAIARLADREDFDSTLLRAQILTRAADYEAAISVYDTLLEERPSDYRIMVGKGIALSSGGNTQAALNMFAAAADAAPTELQPQIREIAAIYTSEPEPVAIEDLVIEGDADRDADTSTEDGGTTETDTTETDPATTSESPESTPAE